MEFTRAADNEKHLVWHTTMKDAENRSQRERDRTSRIERKTEAEQREVEID